MRHALTTFTRRTTPFVRQNMMMPYAYASHRQFWSRYSTLSFDEAYAQAPHKIERDLLQHFKETLDKSEKKYDIRVQHNEAADSPGVKKKPFSRIVTLIIPSRNLRDELEYTYKFYLDRNGITDFDTQEKMTSDVVEYLAKHEASHILNNDHRNAAIAHTLMFYTLSHVMLYGLEAPLATSIFSAIMISKLLHKPLSYRQEMRADKSAYVDLSLKQMESVIMYHKALDSCEDMEKFYMTDFERTTHFALNSIFAGTHPSDKKRAHVANNVLETKYQQQSSKKPEEQEKNDLTTHRLL